MTGLFADDGCVIPNIATQDYRFTFTAKCGHTKVRSAEIIISAPSEQNARVYAEDWLLQGVMHQTVLTGVEEIR